MELIPVVRHMFYPNTTGNIPRLFVPEHHTPPRPGSHLVYWITPEQARLLRTYDAVGLAVGASLPKSVFERLLTVRNDWSKK